MMSILINKNTRVITQGITGKTGQFHTQHDARDYANGKNCYVAGVNPEEGAARTSRASRSSTRVNEAEGEDRRDTSR